jgi:mRNA interferase YafQ
MPAFNRALKKARKKHYDLDQLKDVVVLLSNGTELPKHYHDHELKGNWAGTRELHITNDPDWLLIYSANENVVVLERMGSHDELFL